VVACTVVQTCNNGVDQFKPIFHVLSVSVIFFKYLACNFDDLELGQFKIIQGHRSWYQSIAPGRLPVRLLLSPTPYLSPFLKYLTCTFDDHELGQFKVIQGQRIWCQWIAQWRFHIRLPFTHSGICYRF